MNATQAKPLIVLITEGGSTAGNFPEQKAKILATIREAVRIGIPIVQIREKSLPAKALFELTEAAVTVTAASRTRILVNGRFDIAIAARADGVHLTAHSLPCAVVRKLCPPNFVVGISAHSIEEALSAKANGADFALLAPVFATPGKGEPLGLELLGDAARQLSPFPIVALGGIDASNYCSVLNAGAGGFAAIRFLNDLGNLRSIAALLV